ncbi:hypothetical protein [Streptococcus minor]|nr:hypothetical protein [Streptococcus minor]
MYSREYRCLECDHNWSETSEYTALECPECQAEEFIVTWQARAYD